MAKKAVSPLFTALILGVSLISVIYFFISTKAINLKHDLKFSALEIFVGEYFRGILDVGSTSNYEIDKGFYSLASEYFQLKYPAFNLTILSEDRILFDENITKCTPLQECPYYMDLFSTQKEYVSTRLSEILDKRIENFNKKAKIIRMSLKDSNIALSRNLDYTFTATIVLQTEGTSHSTEKIPGISIQEKIEYTQEFEIVRSWSEALSWKWFVEDSTEQFEDYILSKEIIDTIRNILISGNPLQASKPKVIDNENITAYLRFNKLSCYNDIAEYDLFLDIKGKIINSPAKFYDKKLLIPYQTTLKGYFKTNCSMYDTIKVDERSDVCKWYDIGCKDDGCNLIEKINIDCDTYDKKTSGSTYVVDYEANSFSCTFGCSGTGCCDPVASGTCDSTTHSNCQSITIEGTTLYCTYDGTSWAWRTSYPAEVCGDGIDNDCDGLVDCADPDCAGQTDANGNICCQVDTDCPSDSYYCSGDSVVMDDWYCDTNTNICKVNTGVNVQNCNDLDFNETDTNENTCKWEDYSCSDESCSLVDSETVDCDTYEKIDSTDPSIAYIYNATDEKCIIGCKEKECCNEIQMICSSTLEGETIQIGNNDIEYECIYDSSTDSYKWQRVIAPPASMD